MYLRLTLFTYVFVVTMSLLLGPNFNACRWMAKLFSKLRELLCKLDGFHMGLSFFSLSFVSLMAESAKYKISDDQAKFRFWSKIINKMANKSKLYKCIWNCYAGAFLSFIWTKPIKLTSLINSKIFIKSIASHED